jgi:hypothetical protein
VSGGTYPIAVGTFLRPAKVLIESVSPSFVSTPHSLKQIRRSRGAHRWHLKITYGPCTKDEWNAVVAFLDEQQGQYGKFSIVVPGKEAPRGGVSGATQVNGAQAAGALSVNLKNLPLTINGVFKAGDLVKFAGHLKVYEITRDANSNGAGQAAVFINCPVLSAIADAEAVTYANVPMNVALIADTLDREYGGGGVNQGFQIELIEDPY